MNKIKEFINIVKVNFKTMFLFELIYKILIALILLPLAVSLFNLSMKITGFSYITLENIFSFILNPITLLFIILIIIYLTIVTLFDYSTLLIIFDESYNNKKITLTDSIYNSFYKCKNLMKPKNISVAFLLLFLIPFLNIGFSTNVITVIKIPEFITDYIYSNYILLSLFIIIYLLLILLLSKWIYSLHYMILEDKDFKTSRKLSSNLSKNNRIKDLIKILIYQLISYIVYVLFIFIGIVIIYLIYKILYSFKIIESIFISIIWIFMIIVIFLIYIVSNSISYMIITNLYFNHKKEKNELISSSNYKITNKKRLHVSKKIIIIILSIVVIFSSIFTYLVINKKINLNIENIKIMELTAHRGASTKRPENTMSSFILANELGADAIELDVQQTKDGVIVVSHDTNLYRVSGVDVNIIDLTYDELSKIDVGSFFSVEYKDERIPKLEDVVIFAKENNIKLNIELKPVGTEIDFEKSVIDIINKYNFSNMCVVTSQKYEVLENVKNIDDSIKTIYVMSIAIGNITDLEYADGYSLEASNVNKTIVSSIHNAGKEVYAWTINTEDSINEMISFGVDNIITDNVTLGKELIIKSKESNLIYDFVLKLLEIGE